MLRGLSPSLAAVATTAVLTLLAGCSGNGGTSVAPPPAAASAAPSSPNATSAPAGTQVDKILTFVIENKSVEQVMSQMPAVRQLAQTYGYAADYSAVEHPSLPNYLAMIGGQTYGVRDDDPPAVHAVTGSSVLGEAISAGRTARLYAEGMPTPCATTSGPGDYAVKHNPWAYFVDERTLCQQFDVPLDTFAADAAAGRLPNVGMAVPDMCNSAHNCPLSVTDAWLAARMREITAGPDWKSGRLAVVITADEDDDRHGNKIMTVVVHPGLHQVVAQTPLTHYSLTRAYAEVAGVTPPNNAAGAASLLTAFGLQPAS